MPKKKKEDEILNEFDDFDDFDELAIEDIQEEKIEKPIENLSPKKEIKKEMPATDKVGLEDAEEVVKANVKEDNVSSIETAVDISVNVTAVIGRTNITVRDLLEYKTGTVVDLHRSPGETVDMMAGGKLIARGELVDLDGRMGVKILKMLR